MSADKNEKSISMDHGSGGKQSAQLISNIFLKYFDNTILNSLTDSAVLKTDSANISFTTDSYVVKPIFFPGGNIGKIAVCGTVNDLSVSGADPLYLSAGFIIEEGFPFEKLEKIVKSMADTAKECGVAIVTGDTKVVEKGSCDGIFINTSGIGILKSELRNISFAENVEPGDKIIINGSIADHGITILAARKEFNLDIEIESDCAPLNGLISILTKDPELSAGIKFMRDATRGGLGTVLCELSEKTGYDISIDEAAIPMKESVKGICEMLGFDPLYIANEGKVVICLSKNIAEKALNKLKKHELGKESCIIGEITDSKKKLTILKTLSGGTRIVHPLSGVQLPRIC